MSTAGGRIVRALRGLAGGPRRPPNGGRGCPSPARPTTIPDVRSRLLERVRPEDRHRAAFIAATSCPMGTDRSIAGQNIRWQCYVRSRTAKNAAGPRRLGYIRVVLGRFLEQVLAGNGRLIPRKGRFRIHGDRRLKALGLSVLILTVAGCQGSGTKRASAPEPALSGALDSGGAVAEATPSKTVTYVDRHPIFAKPQRVLGWRRGQQDREGRRGDVHRGPRRHLQRDEADRRRDASGDAMKREEGARRSTMSLVSCRTRSRCRVACRLTGPG